MSSSRSFPLSNIHESTEEFIVINEEQSKKYLNINEFHWNPTYPLFFLDDIDGFVALSMNNLATLLAIILGLQLLFESDIIYGKIIPG